jgi:hypothetical protein
MKGDEIVWRSPMGKDISKYACRRNAGSTNSCRGVSRIAWITSRVLDPCRHDRFVHHPLPRPVEFGPRLRGGR